MRNIRCILFSAVFSILAISNSYSQITATFNPFIFPGPIGTINYGSVTVAKTGDQMIVIHRTDMTSGTMNCTITPPATATYSVVNHALTFTVAAGARDTIVVRFAPASAGTFNDTIKIEHNADTSGAFFHLFDPMVYALKGTGVKSDTFPKISVSPMSINFGSITVGKSSSTGPGPAIVTVKNLSDTQRTLDGSVSLPKNPSFLMVSGDGPFSLDSGSEIQAAISFNPLTADTLRDTIWVTSNANAQNNNIPIILRGIGVKPSPYPIIRVSIPGSFGGNVNFGRDTLGVSTPKLIRIQIANQPDMKNTLMATITPPKAPFAIDSGSLSLSLDSGKATLIRLTFTPDSVGAYRDSITIAGSNTDPTTLPTKIYLTGSAVSLTGAHIVLPSPALLNFGNTIKQNSSPLSLTATIKNAGQTAKDTLVGTVAPPKTPFTITSGSGAFSLGQTDLLNIVVQLATNKAGTFTDQIMITSNSNDNLKAAIIRLSATVVSSGAVKDGKPVMEYIAVIPNPFSSITRINFSLTEAIPVSMKIFDLLGKEVFSSPEKMYAAGTGEIEWNANGLGNGTYLCVLKIGSEMRSVRVVLDK